MLWFWMCKVPRIYIRTSLLLGMDNYLDSKRSFGQWDTANCDILQWIYDCRICGPVRFVIGDVHGVYPCGSSYTDVQPGHDIRANPRRYVYHRNLPVSLFQLAIPIDIDTLTISISMVIPTCPGERRFSVEIDSRPLLHVLRKGFQFISRANNRCRLSKRPRCFWGRYLSNASPILTACSCGWTHGATLDTVYILEIYLYLWVNRWTRVTTGFIVFWNAIFSETRRIAWWVSWRCPAKDEPLFYYF